MRQYLIDLMKGLEAAIPPPPKCHHAITYARYGSNEDGFEDKLSLQLNIGGVLTSYFLDAEDFDQPPDGLVRAIKSIASRPISADDQLGVGFGQYVQPERE